MQKQPKIQEIKHPRRLLILGPPDSGVLGLLKDLTGTAPDPRTITEHANDSEATNASVNSNVTPTAPELRTTVAGQNHTLALTTKYYTTTVPIWLDEATDPEAWAHDFSEPGAAEVVRAVGAWVVVFRDSLGNAGRATARALMAAVRAAIEKAHGGAGVWDGVCLVVGMPPSIGSGPGGANTDAHAESEELQGDGWEDTCWDLGFEYVDGSITGKEAEVRNAVGERRGVARVRDALEACEWDAAVDELDTFELNAEDEEANALHAIESDGETLGFGLERAEMERDFAGLKLAMAGGEDDPGGEGEAEQVEELERMMLRLQAVKDMSAGMPEEERKRLAKKAVNDVMNDI